MTAEARSMEPAKAAEILRAKLPAELRPMTVADASVASGLALRDAEAGLHFLTSEYRGHLRVTEDGDLVHVFPHGFTKPWETQEAAARLFAAAARTLLGVARFILRAWLLIVMVSYALLFIALVVGATFARGGSSDRQQGSGLAILGGLARMIGDALFWTLHPFSPVHMALVDERRAAFAGASFGRVQPRRQRVPFYEKVNRFVFGPPAPPADPHAARARVLDEIRAKKGRVGLADVMRVTGLPRHEADPLMARLMLDHDGVVEVAEGGGIVYRFEALRRTADERATGATAQAPRAAWESLVTLPPLTGNGPGSNVAIALLNGFNLAAAAWATSIGLTLSNVALLFAKHPPPILPDDGTPVAFGLVPLLFSVALFAAPAVRWASRFGAARRAGRENARLAILREVLARAPKREPVTDDALRRAHRLATGEEPTSKEITARVVELGGDVDVGPEGEVRYRFPELEAEAEALEDERARASDAEARLGRVVFASDAS